MIKDNIYQFDRHHYYKIFMYFHTNGALKGEAFFFVVFGKANMLLVLN